ncbi:MAG TPA: hypothetical protein VK116_15630 [Planctomycetota bacterium]|nr:hypothetical protein [Planctomycetota bacterium]
MSSSSLFFVFVVDGPLGIGAPPALATFLPLIERPHEPIGPVGG